MVEVLVAIVILSFALLAYLSATQASNAFLSDGCEFTIASQAAGNQIAQVQGLGYSGLTNGTTTTSVPGLPSGQMTVVIGPLDGSTANIGIKQIDVTVTWSPRKIGQTSTTTSFKESMLICNH
jgi:type II secretory pathway pseudopilin PulG